MARKQREDAPNTWHHVSNRSVGQRPIFETRRDARFFLSRIARQVRAGRIEIHAYTVLVNHFHVLARSVTGELSAAFQWIQDQYARWFNWTRGRDGHVFGKRYWSAMIRTAVYWEAVFHYIARNAVLAGLAKAPADYPYGSAFQYARTCGPIWLTRTIGDAVTKQSGGKGRQFPRAVVERRMAGNVKGSDPLDKLVRASSSTTEQWLREKAWGADRAPVGVSLVDPSTLLSQVTRTGEGTTRISRDQTVLVAGLLRVAAGLKQQGIGEMLGVSHATVSRMVDELRRRVVEDSDFACLAAGALRTALAQDYEGLVLPPVLLEVFRPTSC